MSKSRGFFLNEAAKYEDSVLFLWPYVEKNSPFRGTGDPHSS